MDSFKIIESKIYKTNFLIWTGLRHSVPKHLKESNVQLTSLCSFIIEDVFDVTKKKSKHFYSLLQNKKAQLPNMARKLQNEFNFASAQRQQMFNLPHQVALEPYVKGFQYKVLNFILYTNTKLHKIGYSTDDHCTFCKLGRETLYHLLFSCPYSRTFWNSFETLVFIY